MSLVLPATSYWSVQVVHYLTPYATCNELPTAPRDLV